MGAGVAVGTSLALASAVASRMVLTAAATMVASVSGCSAWASSLPPETAHRKQGHRRQHGDQGKLGEKSDSSWCSYQFQILYREPLFIINVRRQHSIFLHLATRYVWMSTASHTSLRRNGDTMPTSAANR